ncbi:hypothetical protein CFP56_010245 [Quercus suber]|uniref:Uncharacterized protein n=1 Tax=Quercus suber TaxID=58331 RepID=A0AAW0L0Y9_QUESU|nr:hypothetical protein CFP56_46555 [Quercus suber]
MLNTWEKLMMISSFDHQSIIVPLLKSFIQAQLVNMADKDATKKPNVTIDAPLSELDLDDKKNIEKGGDGERQGPGKIEK